MHPLTIDEVVEVEIGRQLFASDFSKLGSYGYGYSGQAQYVHIPDVSEFDNYEYPGHVHVMPYIEDAEEFHAAYVATIQEGGEYQDNNCKITKYSVTITREDSCIVFVYLVHTQKYDPSRFISEQGDLRIFDFKGRENLALIAPTTTATTTVAPTTTAAPTTAAAPTTTVVPTTTVEPEECVEAFVFEESSEPSDQSSIFDYTYWSTESDVTVRLKLLPCNDLQNLATVDDGPLVNLQFQSVTPVDVAYELFYIDRSGQEKLYKKIVSGKNYPTSQNTHVGHMWVIRVARPEAQLEFVDDCSNEENPEKWTFTKQRVFGWSMYIACLLPAERRNEFIEGLGHELSYVNELLPQVALNDLWNVNIWVHYEPPIDSDGFYLQPYHSGVHNGISFPEGSQDAIHIGGRRLKINDPREPAFILHEIAHAWDHRYNPNSDYVYSDDGHSRGGPGTNQVIDAYINAKKSGLYDGNPYCVSNADEYFACTTERLFWRGVAFPFEKSELLEYDPQGAAAVEAAWNTVPETTIFEPPPPEWEYISSAEAGTCIEGFVVRDEPQTNPPESFLKYEISPLGDDTNLHLHIFGCDGIDQLKSRSTPWGFEVEISTEVPYTEVGKVLEIKWISTDGIEWKNRDSFLDVNNKIPPTLTWREHFFVVRVGSEPELKYVESCPLNGQVKDWTVESHQLAGWTVNVDCHIPEGLRVLWVEEFEKDLAYIAEIIPQTALPYARDVKYWILSPGLFGSDIADYVTGVGPSTPREIIGGIRMASGQGPPSTMHNPEERRAVFALHELAHAWDYMIYPDDQRAATGACLVEQWIPGQTYGENPVMVNCRAETPITDAYFAAREAGIYEQVETLGPVEDSYALSNHDEYFAVLTQAYFWTSYFYPFNREQLLEHDPVGAAAVEAAWNMIPDS
jgi:hypothetical protein